jgi:hypothetical protein
MSNMLSSRKPHILAYAPGTNRMTSRGWRVAFWLGVIYLLSLGVLLAGNIWPMRLFFMFPRGAPLREPYVIAFFMVQTIPPVLACMNVLPVIGYALGALGRSPYKVLMTYVVVQPLLIALLIAAGVFDVWHGPLRFSHAIPNRIGGEAIYLVHISFKSVVVSAGASLMLSLPLIACMIHGRGQASQHRASRNT